MASRPQLITKISLSLSFVLPYLGLLLMHILVSCPQFLAIPQIPLRKGALESGFPLVKAG